MTPERWKNIKDEIRDSFEVLDSGSYHEDEEGGIDTEFIEFKGPLGLMRLEFIAKPIVLDKKTTFSRRIGSETKVEYIYSEEEKSHKFKIYKWNDETDDWEEVDQKHFTL